MCGKVPNHRFSIVGKLNHQRRRLQLRTWLPLAAHRRGLVTMKHEFRFFPNVPSGKPEIDETNFRPIIVRRDERRIYKQLVGVRKVQQTGAHWMAWQPCDQDNRTPTPKRHRGTATIAPTDPLPLQIERACAEIDNAMMPVENFGA